MGALKRFWRRFWHSEIHLPTHSSVDPIAEFDEIINRVERNDNGELILILESGGRAGYQHIYRLGVDVYWNQDRGGFTYKPSTSLSCFDCYSHIHSTCNEGNAYFSIRLGPDVTWINVSPIQRAKIEERFRD